MGSLLPPRQILVMESLSSLDPPIPRLRCLRSGCGSSLDALLTCSVYLHMVIQVWQEVGYKDGQWLI